MLHVFLHALLFLNRALKTLAFGRMHGDDVVDWLTQNVRNTDPDVLEIREQALQDLGRRGSLVVRRPVAPTGTNVVHGEDATGASSSNTVLTTNDRPTVAVNDDADSLYEPPESLYEPPGDSDTEGYVSPAVSEGFGSIGDLDFSDFE